MSSERFGNRLAASKSICLALDRKVARQDLTGSGHKSAATQVSTAAHFARVDDSCRIADAESQLQSVAKRMFRLGAHVGATSTIRDADRRYNRPPALSCGIHRCVPLNLGTADKEQRVVHDIDRLKSDIKRWTLVLGVLQITVGCLVGFIPPSAVAWFRGIVMAHIEFTANGVLMVAFAFLVKELNLRPLALKTWFGALQIGTWTNGGAGAAAAFIGASSRLMPTINEKFPAPQGADNAIVTGLLQLCGVTIMVTLLLTLYGLLRARTTAKDTIP